MLVLGNSSSLSTSACTFFQNRSHLFQNVCVVLDVVLISLQIASCFSHFSILELLKSYEPFTLLLQTEVDIENKDER